MKKISVIFYLIFFVQFVYCQTKILKMDSWTEYSEGYVQGNIICGVERFAIIGDTIINSVEYRKVFRNGKYNYAIRETADSLVYVYYDVYKKEFLLYDFAWKIGKQITSVNLGDESEYVYAKIEKIDTLVLENGLNLPCITTNLGTKCIQGIGDTEGFISHLDLVHSDSEVADKLWCVYDSRDTSLLYKDKDCKNCNICEQGLVIENMSVELAISPNPVKDILHLTLPTANNSIQIIDAQGKKVLQTECGETASVNVSHLKNGVYTIIVNNKQSQTFVKE